MEKYKISVIIPIFNAEKYLSKTIDSVIKQSFGFENIELILVDDKSTDNSRSVIAEYSSKYDNIIPIYFDKNSGNAGPVRNKGLDVATSAYIMFMDADDEYEYDMCEKLYTTLIESKCDGIGCNILGVEEIENNSKISYKTEKMILTPEDISYYLVWNKIYKKDIIDHNQIRFKDFVGEDGLFSFEYLLCSTSFIHLNDYFGYKYFNRVGSYSTLTATWLLKIIHHYHYIYDLLNKYKTSNFKMNKNNFFINRIDDIFMGLINIKKINKKETYEVLEQLYLFEKKINFKKQPHNFILKITNHLLLNNHINMATMFILTVNKSYNNEIIMNIYRNFKRNK